MHEGSASYLFLDGPRLSTEMLFCSLLEMMKVYLDDRGACWAAGLDVVQVERDKRHSTPPVGPVFGPPAPDLCSRSWALAGGGDLMAVVIPHPCFVSSPGRSHLTTHHSPFTAPQPH